MRNIKRSLLPENPSEVLAMPLPLRRSAVSSRSTRRPLFYLFATKNANNS
jgi:hypothetical protein